jgi:hypothetical protein
MPALRLAPRSSNVPAKLLSEPHDKCKPAAPIDSADAQKHCYRYQVQDIKHRILIRGRTAKGYQRL